MRLHLPLVPGESPDNPQLAFTTLACQFARMMRDQGHEVNEIPHDGPRPDWTDQAAWDRISREQARQIDDGIICLPVGAAQRVFLETGHPCVEYAVGYGGTVAPWRAFPSHAWMHTVIGSQQGAHSANGTWGDTVIPHPLDPDQHELGTGHGGYLLFVGRLIERKGLSVAIAAAKRAGLPLLAAGEGDYRPAGPEYLGPVNTAERSELMGGAIALLAPTLYIEPFGLVVTEAQACGTPAITTDWGAFTETVEPGFRCSTDHDFAVAIEEAATVDRQTLRDRTLARYSMNAIAPLYDRFLTRIGKDNHCD